MAWKSCEVVVQKIIPWNGMWNKKKLMEWNGSGMKINSGNSTRIYEMKTIMNFNIF
jgi:hypothetical protein